MLNHGRWQEIEELFNEAVQIPAPHRTSFVKERCGGDPEVCEEVISLLNVDTRDSGVLEDSVFPLVAQLLDEDFTELIGKKDFASYELLEIIGRGGMGTVFLARDNRLEREVALKILPSTTATSTENVIRFEQEAKAASAISHPNVAHIYEFGTHNGLYFLAMEYVDGVTLRELMKPGKVDLKCSVDAAIQIAKALGAAHKVGVIHRDVKPENVIVDSDLVCKVLDFGLAKLNEKKWRKSSKSLETVPGLIIGTSTYMSPEQVRGQTVDERTDIWSLGVILYEMLTVERPFGGETTSDVQAAILLKEPPQFTVPPHLQKLKEIVFKALKKDALERYQTIGEMLEDLLDVRRELQGNERRSEAINPRRGLFWFATGNAFSIGAISILLAAAAFGSFFVYRWLTDDGRAFTAVVGRTQRVTNSGKALQVALSPDGQSAAYVLEEAGKEALYLRSTGDNAAPTRLIVPPLTEKGGFVGVTFTPDGQFIYYAFKSEGIYASLYRLPASAGGDTPPEKLLEDIDGPPSFSPDGRRIVFLRIGPDADREELIVTNADGSGQEVFYTRRMPDFIPHKATPAWSPDGKMIACAIGLEEGGRKKVRLVGIDTADRSITPISPEDWTQIAQTSWAGDGKSIFAAARKTAAREEKQVWQIGYPGGAAASLTDDPNDYEGISVSRDGGSVLTVAINRKVDIWVQEFEGSALPTIDQPRQLTFGEDVANGVVWTADGGIAYSSTASGNSDIWIMDGSGGNPRQLTTDPSADTQPVASPDNRYVVFLSTRSGERQIWRMDLDGGGQVQLTSGPELNTPAITADARFVIYYAQVEGGGALFRVSMDGGPSEVIARGVRRFPAASPDGKWLVSSCRPAGATNNMICVSPISDPADLARVYEPVAGANSPSKLRWAGNQSKAFTYIVNNRGVENLWNQPLDGGAPFQVTRFSEGYMYAFDWSPDAKRLICGRGNTINSAMLFSLRY